MTLIELMIVISIIAVLLVVIVPRLRRVQDRARLTACVTNLKTLALALTIYSNDTMGKYPSSLPLLVPDYIQKMPECPSALRATYIQGYSINDNADTFTVACKGRYHAPSGYGADEPYFLSTRGIGP